jgi:CheY-like chemotaxis protein
VVRVTDTGIGIEPEFLPHVFERFRQADGSLTREHGGLGLGLSIAKDLVELHGGVISASSDGRGRGAAFTIEFPMALPVAEAAPSATSSAGDGRISLAGLRVMAVDDNADALEVLRTALTSAGAVVDLAHTGEDAVAAWARTPGDVLVCDLAMPRLSGFDVLAHVRTLNRQHGRATRAIAVTAHASEETRARCLAAGFGDYLTKPLDARHLVRVVASVAEREGAGERT